MMRQWRMQALLGTLVGVMGLPAAFGQDEQSGRRGRREREGDPLAQRRARGDRGDRGGRWGGGFRGRRGLDLDRLAQEMNAQLRLTADQKEKVDELLAEFEEQNQARREEQRQRFGNRGGEFRQLFEDMRAAREAGDDQKLEELRAKFQEIRGAGGGGPGGGRGGFGGRGGQSPELNEVFQQMREAREAGDNERMRELGEKLRELRGRGIGGRQDPASQLFGRIGEVLRPDQRGKFREIVQQLSRRGRGGRGPQSLDQIRPPGEFVEAAQAARIPPEKLEAIRQLVQEFEEALRDVGPEGQADLFGQYREEIDKLAREINLSNEERQRILASAQRQGGGRGRGGLGDRGGIGGRRGGRRGPGGAGGRGDGQDP